MAADSGGRSRCLVGQVSRRGSGVRAGVMRTDWKRRRPGLAVRCTIHTIRRNCLWYAARKRRNRGSRGHGMDGSDDEQDVPVTDGDAAAGAGAWG
jgi:hypothetical protein